MSSFLFTLEGWPTGPSTNNIARSFDNDSLLWSTSIAAPPFSGTVVSTSTTNRQRGTWDGSLWYVIGPDGKLYAYDPDGDSWSAALFGGVAIISGTVEDQYWSMTCDGRFLYILDSSAGFRRYDPVADSLSALSSIAGNAYSGKILLDYDGDDTIFGYKGGTDAAHKISKYTISTDTWTVLTANVTLSGHLTNNHPTWSAYLQGAWWLFYFSTGENAARAWKYDPDGDTWTQMSTLTAAIASVEHISPWGEMTDSLVRFWTSSSSVATMDYNVGTDTWTRGVNSPATFRQGTNFAVTRLFQPIFTWLESDGTTPTDPTELLGTLVQGDTLTTHLKLQIEQNHAAGITVAVAASFTTDAEDPVTVCQTAGGTFAASFATGAVVAGQKIDVYVKLSPTVFSTPGMSKTFNILPTGN